MKTAIFIFCLLFTARLLADAPDTPAHHFFTVPSPSNTCFAVHTVLPWKGDSESIVGRIQLFNTQTGTELWRINQVLCYDNEVFPSDDGHHLVIIRSFFSIYAPSDYAVLWFYADGKPIKSYSLKQLGFDPSKLAKTVSHARFMEVQRPQNNWDWAWPPDSEQAKQMSAAIGTNPLWQGNQLELKMRDDQLLRFNASTGELLSKNQLPKSEKTDPFSE